MDLALTTRRKDVPVATDSINNSANTAQLAARVLATSDINIRNRLQAQLANQKDPAFVKADGMEREGLRPMIRRSKAFLQGRQPGAPDVGSVQHNTFMDIYRIGSFVPKATYIQRRKQNKLLTLPTRRGTGKPNK